MRARFGLVHRLTVVFLLLAAAASAHMKLKETSPEMDATEASKPESIRLWFTQRPDVAVSTVELRGPDGEVELGEVKSMDDRSIVASVLGDTPDGDYTVKWQTAGDDGHIQRGEFDFTVSRGEDLHR